MTQSDKMKYNTTRIFITKSSDRDNILIRADNKKDALLKLKNKIGYKEAVKDLLADREVIEWYKDVVNGLAEIQTDTLIKFYGFFFIKEDIVFLPSFGVGSKSFVAIREFTEHISNSKLFNLSRYKDLQEKLQQTEKVGLYDNLVRKILDIAEEIKKI